MSWPLDAGTMAYVTYPNEIKPLVDDLNLLLDYRELTMRSAQAKAADLAHESGSGL
jgi:hypothetical protein